MTRETKSDADFVDSALRSLEQPEPSADLLRLVAELPLRHPRKTMRWWWPFEGVLQPAFGFLTVAALGLATGWGWSTAPSSTATEQLLGQIEARSEDELSADALAAQPTYDELDSLFALAFTGSSEWEDWVAGDVLAEPDTTNSQIQEEESL